eukprot:2514794-Lingulodinium_polyedra.AAC.1
MRMRAIAEITFGVLARRKTPTKSSSSSPPRHNGKAPLASRLSTAMSPLATPSKTTRRRSPCAPPGTP